MKISASMKMELQFSILLFFLFFFEICIFQVSKNFALKILPLGVTPFLFYVNV